MTGKAVVVQAAGEGPLPRGRISEIARELGVTRQYVARVLGARRVAERGPRCPRCGGVSTRHRVLCERCRPAAAVAELTCSTCCQTFTRRLSWSTRAKGHYCSRACWVTRAKGDNQETPG